MRALLVLIVFASGCSTLASKEAAVGCQVADAVTTRLAIGHGAHELNPLAARVLDSFGWGGFFIFKAVLTVAILAMQEKVNPTVAATVNGATCLAAASNARFVR